MGGINFDERLLNYAEAVRKNKWGLHRTLGAVRKDLPLVTEQEIRRFLYWLVRTPDTTNGDAAWENEAAAKLRAFDTSRQRAVERDALRWRSYDKEVLSRLERHFAGRAEHVVVEDTPRVGQGQEPSPFIVVTSATDFHWGMYAWDGESSDPYNREVARERLRKHTRRIVERLHGVPEEIIVAIGSDFFHIDGDSPTTTKGTVMQGVDGTPLEILVTGIDQQIEQILALREVAPVRIVQMAGNHDRVNAYTALLVLHAWARNVPGVTVVLDYRPRVYHKYGDTLLVFAHGDGAKPEKLPSIAAVEARQDWGATPHHVAFGGHKHCQRVEEHPGLTYYQLRSLAGTDRWHSREGWVGAKKGLDAYIVDKEDGVIGAIYSVEA